ncbi:MAG: murein biosynthesis integral membrane protein MurJ, partial [Gammaproteobacteria bacterium]|nr:murein biosynthesis integral membrane protein MurJ [Gammaproteobacteria bacterium]
MSRRLLKSTAVVGGNTLISRVLGLVRDIVIARLFGAEAGTDAFFVAFKIPNFFRRLFAEGAFSQAFVPVLAEYKEKDEKGLSELIANTAGTLGGILLVLTIIAELAAPWLVILFGPGFYMEGGEKYALTVDMLRVTFPYLMLISLTALAGGVLNTFGR